MASGRLKSRMGRSKRASSDADNDSPEMQPSKTREPKPALSQEDLVRILKIIKKYNQDT